MYLAWKGDWGAHRVPMLISMFLNKFSIQALVVKDVGKCENQGLPGLELARGHSSWSWPKGSQPLGMRMRLNRVKMTSTCACMRNWISQIILLFRVTFYVKLFWYSPTIILLFLAFFQPLIPTFLPYIKLYVSMTKSSVLWALHLLTRFLAYCYLAYSGLPTTCKYTRSF